MSIIKKIEEALRNEYNSGKTQQEMANHHGVKQSQIQKILSGERAVSGLSAATIEKMFPRATIHLNGDPAPASVPALPSDPFLRMVVESWSRLTPEERGRVAGLVSGLVEGKNHAAARADGQKRIG